MGLADVRWLVDNIVRKVGDGRTTLFWKYPWLDDVPLASSYARFFELSHTKFATVWEMCVLGWGAEGGRMEVEEEVICVGGRFGGVVCGGVV